MGRVEICRVKEQSRDAVPLPEKAVATGKRELMPVMSQQAKLKGTTPKSFQGKRIIYNNV